MNEGESKNVVPITKPTGGSGSNGGIGDRVTALETHLQYLAKKEDIKDLKIWILAGVVGGMALAVGLAMTFLKLFGPVVSP